MHYHLVSMLTANKRGGTWVYLSSTLIRLSKMYCVNPWTIPFKVHLVHLDEQSAICLLEPSISINHNLTDIT